MSCQDSKDCKTISTAVAAQGLDVCQNKNLKHFCNYTCGLCPGQTTNGTRVYNVDPYINLIEQSLFLLFSPFGLQNLLLNRMAIRKALNPGLCSMRDVAYVVISEADSKYMIAKKC